jgi:ATP-dependent exoDNAse (exonuclease V) beta subunit
MEFLGELVTGGKQAEELKKNLKRLYNDIEFSEENISYIKQVYQKIITNKNKLNISTLDSFINTIFKSLIAPYHNITGYSIDPLINDDILPEIYDTILSDNNFHLLDNIFKLKLNRNISSYNDFIKAIIDNRWLFEFYFKSDIPEIDIKTAANQSYEEFIKIAHDFCQQFSWVYNEFYQSKPWDKTFARSWFATLNENDKMRYVLPSAIGDYLFAFLQNRDFISQKYPLINSSNNIWNGGSILRGNKFADYKDELLELQDKLFKAWKNFLFWELVKPEQQDILELSKIIFQKYDEIKFRDKILTYNDLAFYTWKYLYDPEISIIDQHEVLNIFYEQLSYRIKFILIDEFQDTSILQWNIFAPLIREILAGAGSSEIGSFIVVGDEKQAIYSWRSGERELLLRMEKLLNLEFRSDELKTSYRSSKAVIDLVNQLFSDTYYKEKISDSQLNWKYPLVDTIKKDSGYARIQITNLKNGKETRDLREEVEEFIKNIYLPAVDKKQLNPASTAILTRTHKEMNTVSAVLREMKIDYIDETSLSIVEHRAVKPVLAILNWFYNLDLSSLLAFLRSDAILLDSEKLKDILECWQDCQTNNTAFCQTLSEKFIKLEPIKIMSSLQRQNLAPLQLTKAIIKDFNLISTFNQEADQANLTKFLDIIARFLANNLDYSHDLGGLLRYLLDNQKAEAFAQTGIQQQDVLKIITIHKSKGLEFDTVILIQNCPSRTSHLSELSILPNYTPDFTALDGAMFTYNFTSLLKDSPAQKLLDLQTKRRCIESINVWYVALTRAKRNIFALITYAIKDGLEKYVESFQPDKPDINKLVVGSLINAFPDESTLQDDSLIITLGELQPAPIEKELTSATLTNLIDISNWFSAPPSDYFRSRDNWQDDISPQNRHLLANAQIMGNIAHYYLEQIRFDSPAARKLAAQRTIAFYGSLMKADAIQNVIQKANQILSDNANFFDQNIWDNVFCEWSIFDDQKKEFRIDRLLVSHQRKEIQVVDYKTGRITNSDQLNNYIKLLQKIPFVSEQSYKLLPGIFLKIIL